MLRWLLIRLAWLLVTLLGITFVTFAMLDLAPVDRAQLEVMQRTRGGSFTDLSARDQAIVRLRVVYGMLDAETLEPLPLWRRYSNWLGNAVALRLAGPEEDPQVFWRRLTRALPVTAWLGFLALCVACAVGLPLGAWMGIRAGSRGDRALSRLLFLAVGVPEFLLATLLVLAFSVGLRWFPADGLRSHGADQLTMPWQILDFAWHLVLPVAVMAVGPLVLIARFLRDSVARAGAAPFAANLRAWGIEPAVVHWRLLRNGGAPLATLAGSLLPLLVVGSIVVEQVFALDGLGLLAWRAVTEQDQAMVMALTLITSIVTLLALLASDLLHRAVDPRVRHS
jgi:peptide/nickel transport system permease protein